MALGTTSINDQHLQANRPLPSRLHEFLLTGNNLNLLGNNVDAGSYHSNLITTLLMQKELGNYQPFTYYTYLRIKIFVNTY